MIIQSSRNVAASSTYRKKFGRQVEDKNVNSHQTVLPGLDLRHSRKRKRS